MEFLIVMALSAFLLLYMSVLTTKPFWFNFTTFCCYTILCISLYYVKPYGNSWLAIVTIVIISFYIFLMNFILQKKALDIYRRTPNLATLSEYDKRKSDGSMVWVKIAKINVDGFEVFLPEEST